MTTSVAFLQAAKCGASTRTPSYGPMPAVTGESDDGQSIGISNWSLWGKTSNDTSRYGGSVNQVAGRVPQVGVSGGLTLDRFSRYSDNTWHSA